ncbi:sodium:calcium antiporter, partial [Klebsiella pneumoniae]|nr:sodium:calcium antiporter [Klebsiella pneumoniae]
AGVAGLVLALLLGKRIGFGKEPIKPHNLTLTMIGAGLLCYGLAWNGSISRLDGILLLVALIGYTLFLVLASKRDKPGAGVDEFDTEFGPDAGDKPYAWVLQLLLILLGLGLLVGGSNLLIEGAVGLA